MAARVAKDQLDQAEYPLLNSLDPDYYYRDYYNQQFVSGAALGGRPHRSQPTRRKRQQHTSAANVGILGDGAAEPNVLDNPDGQMQYDKRTRQWTDTARQPTGRKRKQDVPVDNTRAKKLASADPRSDGTPTCCRPSATRGR